MGKYVKCVRCGKKTIGNREAWFQDFVDLPKLCNRCIKKERGL